MDWIRKPTRSGLPVALSPCSTRRRGATHERLSTGYFAERVAAARSAGVKLAMVTGDHPATARAIAAQVGFFVGDELVIEGKDLPTDDDLLGGVDNVGGRAVGALPVVLS